MLRITQRCEYAVRALLELALRAGSAPVTIADVAQAQCLPRKFLAVILAQLKQVGVVASARGTHGGYRLAQPPHRVTIGQVVRLVDGPIEPGRGGDGIATSHPDRDVLFDVRQQISQAVEHILDHTTLADLVERENSRRAALATSYMI